MILECVVVGSLEVNCYILASGTDRRAVIIDPGADPDRINAVLARHRLKPGIVVNTHAHFDHIGCDDAFKVPVYVHAADAALLTDSRKNYSAFFGAPSRVTAEVRKLADQERIVVDEIELKVLHIPGHSAGGIALVLEKPESGIVFSGDSLFCRGIGRTDLGGNEDLLLRAIREKLFSLPDQTLVYPGHGPATTIGDEKRDNPFLS